MRKLLVLPLLAAVLFGTTGCMSTPKGGEAGVARNGGMFDNHNIRQIVCPGQGNTNVGWGSDVHYYPDSTSQRTYKLDNAQDADAQPGRYRTKDGYNASISGTYYLKTVFDCSEAGRKALKEFDEAYVNRPDGQRPWEDWSGWLNSTVQPVIDSNMREVIAGFECKQLVSSCALADKNAENINVSELDTNTKSNQALVEQALQDGLAAQLKNQLGYEYFKDIKFNMQAVDLPEVDQQIAQAQQKFTEVAAVRAEVEKEKAQVDKQVQIKRQNREKQKGYIACPSCARQDELKSLPHGITTLVFGGNAPVSIGR